MTEQAARRLANAVRHWLNFQALCGREALFGESYLAQPVGEFLMANHRGRIASEWTVPDLRSKAPGRPRQVDYALLSPETGRLVGAIEVKWVRPGAPSPKQRIVDDLLRLERLRDPHEQHAVRYLLVAGDGSAFDDGFLNVMARSGRRNRKFLRPLLSASTKRYKRVDVEQADEPWQGYFHKFATTYGVDIPKAFRTKLITLSKGGSTRVAVWRVASNSNRATFEPDD